MTDFVAEGKDKGKFHAKLKRGQNAKFSPR